MTFINIVKLATFVKFSRPGISLGRLALGGTVYSTEPQSGEGSPLDAAVIIFNWSFSQKNSKAENQHGHW